MSDGSVGGSEHWVANCPNCGQLAVDSYGTGNEDVREFDCRNENCRCEVFRSETSETENTGSDRE